MARADLNGVPHELWFAPERIAAIQRLAVEVRWCTSWSGKTGILEKALGLPRFLDALAGGGVDVRDRASVAKAKLQAALSVVQTEKRPPVWADDEVIPTAGGELHRLAAARSLLLQVPPATGLQPEHFEMIDEWLGGHS
jgi:hypothetical protein